MLEVNTAILCASVPALKPIFTWKKVQDFRRPHKYSPRGVDPHSLDGQNKAGAFHRKPSDASLYPDLETFNLTQLSSSRSPPRSPTWPNDQDERRPMSPKRGVQEDDVESGVHKQDCFQVV